MKIIENENAVFFDVDDTLLMWDNKHKNEDQSNTVTVTDYSGFTVNLVPHDRHIQYLKDSKIKNQNTIVVWSAGGWQWAKACVEALGLEEYVDAVMAKPERYVDDLDCKQFMGIRIYKDMKK